MHGAKEGHITPALWKKSSARGRRIRIVAAIATFAAAEGLVSVAIPVVAQAPPTPAVRVQRNYQLGGRTWPVDLNRDGITDLVSTGSNGLVQVSIGNGDGTFKAPVASTFQGEVLATGDFNGDSRPDIVASRRTFQQTVFVILPGAGTATLGSPVTVATPGQMDFTFAVSGDLDGDGKRDLVLSSQTGVNVYPGNGNFTFNAPIELVTNGSARDGIVADLNKDGRLDLVTANADTGTISIFLNNGGHLFAPSDLHSPHNTNDVTVADLDHDGSLDLLVAAGNPDTDSSLGDGFVLVFHGKGDGTFAAPVEYPVLRGPMQIVVGDFNRDGVLDVVTGNRSTIVRDDCGAEFKTWDSVSVLTGQANGTFTAARNFSIGDQSLMDISNPEVDRYKNTLVSLNTSDLNGDHATDLIASHGAILFNIPAVANRPPTVNAGPDQVLLNDHGAILRPAASDPDEDVLTYDIRDAAGNFFVTYPNACFESVFQTGDNRVTVTVNDGHGHSATDSVVYTVIETNGGSGQFATGNDIGNVAAAGSDAFDSTTGVYTVRGSGADIWGTADEFHYTWTQWSGDFEITARADSVQNVNAWTKAGVMIRGNLRAGSLHASLFVSPSKGVAFQRRLADSGITVNTPGPATTAPVWLKLQRAGSVIAAYYRKAATDAWTKIDQETFADLPNQVLVGLAVTSHADGKVATATFSDVTLQRALPWTGRAIGNGSGSFSTSGVTITATGRGADIWGAADAFFYVSMPYSDDLTFTARVDRITGAQAWAKAGIMIREDLTAGSRHVMAVVTPGKGVAMQYRPTPGGASVQAADVSGAAPAWVRLVRSNGAFTASWSSDGDHWTVLGTVHVSFAATNFYIGLPVTSHDAATSASATFDDVTIGPPS
jgi:regulation of enolase protein 1 (concanavalin A-like superfamily)